MAGKDDLEILSAAAFLWQLHSKKVKGRVSRAALGEEGEGGIPAAMLFQEKFVLALLHQNDLTISYGNDISPSFKGKKRFTV